MSESDNPDKLEFEFSDDRAAKAGDRMRFEAFTPHIEVPPRYSDIVNWQVFRGVLTL